MLVLTNPVQAYAWGAVDGLAPLLGTVPTGGPEAELWIGAHPAAPSTLADGRPLDAVVADDPVGLLGPEVVARFGPRLPFLLKVLAIGAPLSIQVHPSPEQAAAGYAREEASGVARDDTRRSYRDPHAKPEILVALAPTWVLVGFRSTAGAAAALGRLDDPAVGRLIERVAGAPDPRAALVHLLTAPDGERAALAAAAGRVTDDADPALRWVGRLARAHPGDPSALAPLLLQVRHLAPGEGVFLPAGVPHAYLQGAGVELMGASDNVVRGGLTTKQVDADGLASLLAPPGVGVVDLTGEEVAPSVHRYAPGVPEITLHRIVPGPTGVLAPGHPGGPALAVAVGGPVAVEVGGRVETTTEGRAVLVPASERGACRLSGPGTIWWATVGDPPGGP